MPAPANPARMWNDYGGGNSEHQKAAMATMIRAGFEKYDAAVYARAADLLDAGVFSVRDYLLAVGATWYITCQGDHHAGEGGGGGGGGGGGAGRRGGRLHAAGRPCMGPLRLACRPARAFFFFFFFPPPLAPPPLPRKDCHACFRSGSNIVWRIKKDREAAHLPVEFFWFSTTAASPPEALRVPNGTASRR